MTQKVSEAGLAQRPSTSLQVFSNFITHLRCSVQSWRSWRTAW